MASICASSESILSNVHTMVSFSVNFIYPRHSYWTSREEIVGMISHTYNNKIFLFNAHMNLKTKLEYIKQIRNSEEM